MIGIVLSSICLGLAAVVAVFIAFMWKELEWDRRAVGVLAICAYAWLGAGIMLIAGVTA